MQRALTFVEKALRSVGFQGLANLTLMVREVGGPSKALWRLNVTDDLKKGTLVGTDELGNKYYQNDYYFFGKNRWVLYADHVGFNYDASQICPEWYGWLHYKTDLIPTEDPHRPTYPWMLKYDENQSGYKEAYYAYSTGKPKITLWEPKSKKRT